MTTLSASKHGVFAFFPLLFISMMLSAQAQAQTFDADGLSYTVTDAVANTVEATGRAVGNTNPVIVIPSSVSNSGTTYAVKTIGDSAFESNGLTSVTIGNSVTTIGDQAFAFNNLTSVTIGNSVTTIGGVAFGVNNLTSVIIPDSVTTIKGIAFGGNNLTSVIIPDSVTTIESHAFQFNNLTRVNFLGVFGAFNLNMFKFNTSLETICTVEGASGWPKTFTPNTGPSGSLTSTLCTTPATPTSLSATAGDSRATVSFTAGANNGAAITNYEYSIDGGTTWTAFNPVETTSPVTISGLTNGTAYQIQLRAVNSWGSGAASAAVSVTPVAADSDGDGVPDSSDPFPNADTNEVITGSGTSLSTTPPTFDSSCSILSFSAASVATSKSGVAENGLGTAFSFTLTGCDAATAESMGVSIDLGTPPAAESIAYKVLSNGDWQPISGSQISGSILSYSILDNGQLDQNTAPGTIEDPVTVAVPVASSSDSVTPVPVLPLWGLLSLAGLVGLFGFRKLL